MVKANAGFVGPGRSPLQAQETGRLVLSSGPRLPVPMLVPSSLPAASRRSCLTSPFTVSFYAPQKGVTYQVQTPVTSLQRPIYFGLILSLQFLSLYSLNNHPCPHQLVSLHRTQAYSYSFPEMLCSVSLNMLHH